MTRSRPRPWAVPLGVLDAISTGLVLSILTFFGVAFLTSSLTAMTLCAALVLVMTVWWLASRLTKRLPSLKGRNHLPRLVTGSAVLVIAILSALTVFRPMPTPDAAAATQATFWTLPTGSRLAYTHYPAQGQPQPSPIVLLHGGPGAPGKHRLTPLIRSLNEAGFQVYQYDQIGSGQSARLAEASGYTVARHVADLEAIRQTLQAQRLILIGGSWGATLAAHYLAGHPDRVERAVMSGPGAIWPPAFRAQGGASQGPERALIWRRSNVRFLIATTLLRINPSAAQNYASDLEMSAYFAPVIGQISSSDVQQCTPDGQAAPVQPDAAAAAGFGFYANMVTSADLNRTPDPRPLLGRNTTPVLILRGECERLRWEVAREYRDLFPKATLLIIRGAGHSIDRSAASAHAQAIRAFLLQQPLPFPPYEGENRPESSTTE